MKKPSLLIPILAVVALFAQPVFAEHVHSDGKAVQAVPGETAGTAVKAVDHVSMMQEAMEKMHAQMATINQVKDPKKRLKLLQEHSKSMRDSIKMMREMMGGMTMECPMMGSSHKMGGAMKGECMMGGAMKGECMMGGGMKGECKMGGGMKGECMMGGAMKGECMMAGGMKGECMMGGGMQGGSMAGQAGGNASAAPGTQMTPDKTATADKTATKDGVKHWVCPMHPDVIRDQPGLCPICGMDLVEMDPSGGTAASGHSHMMGGCMKGGGMMGSCMKGGGMKDGCMMNQMMEMSDKHMDMMLMLMEQMIEHNEAAMTARK